MESTKGGMESAEGSMESMQSIAWNHRRRKKGAASTRKANQNSLLHTYLSTNIKF
jgi:hypothetical protein